MAEELVTPRQPVRPAEGQVLVTTYLLNGGERVSLPMRPMVVRFQTSGAVGEYRLVAAVPEGEVLALPRPGMLVLPRITQPTTVRILPALGSELFPAQTVINVLIGPDGGDPEADYVSMTVDASMLPQRELVQLAPFGSTVRVTALGRRPDLPLGPDAEAARDLTRELLGVAFVPADRTVDIRVGVDISPSMRGFAAGGTLAAVLDTFAGIASVIDPNDELEAVLCGALATRLEAVPIKDFAEATVAAVSQQPWSTGSRSATLATADARTVTYLVTDGVPADLRRRPDEPPHLVVLGDPDFARGGTLRRVSRATVVSAGPAADPSGPRWDRAQLRSIVGSLLDAYQITKDGTE